MIDKARMSMEAGATGLIFGRNVWQRGQTNPSASSRACGRSWPNTPLIVDGDGEAKSQRAPTVAATAIAALAV